MEATIITALISLLDFAVRQTTLQGPAQEAELEEYITLRTKLRAELVAQATQPIEQHEEESE